MRKVSIDGETLRIENVVRVARDNALVEIPSKVKAKVKRSREALERLVKENQVIYGISTGFGALSNITIKPQESRQMQTNLIRSHATGVGKPLSTKTTRAMMLLRANTLAKGYSGIRLQTLEALVDMLNQGVHPIVPAKGSVGASGDLAPLSHIILVLMGEGEAEYQGKTMNGREAMKKAGIEPVKLEFKEGVALNNGTQLMTAIAALTVYDAENLIRTAEISAALTLEALLAVSDAFDPRIHRVRPHDGQAITARNIRKLFAGSRLVQTGKEAMQRRQRPHDPYSLRCIPQILGAARDALTFSGRTVDVEINSATDNPLVFPDENTCLSGGNFHGQPISLAMDTLGIALAIVGNVAERRIARLVDDKLSNGLPAFLIPPEAKMGVNSGLMTMQYTAAALASENKILAHPACVDSIPTSANFEDFVSMGVAAAQKAAQILENTEYIVAIELLCAAQAVEFRGAEKLGRGTKAAYDAVRKVVRRLENDRVMSGDIEELRQAIRQHTILAKVEETTAKID